MKQTYNLTIDLIPKDEKYHYNILREELPVYTEEQAINAFRRYLNQDECSVQMTWLASGVTPWHRRQG